jgi:Flp pilus assembly protein CpaB
VPSLPLLLLLLACGADPRPTPPPGQIWVPTARVEIQPGTPISLGDVEWVSLPDEFVAAPVVRRDRDLARQEAIQRLLPGEFIRRERLGPASAPTPTGLSTFRPAVAADVMDVVRMVVFAHDLPAGRAILPADLYAISIPPAYLPENAFLDAARVVGQATCEPVLANELVRLERLRDPATGGCRQ